MTKDEIIEMARQAGGEFYVTSGNQTPTWYFPHSTIYDFVDLVATKATAVEREACAKVCEDYASANTSWTKAAVKDCAAIIRARGEA